MKNFSLITVAVIVVSGCSDKKALKKAALDSVMAVHEKVMATDGKLTDNKMQLDTLIKKGNLSSNDTAFILRAKLLAADSAMDTWMHNFDYEQKGKSDDETVAYMRAQKKVIMSVDSQINSAVSESGKYLLKFKKK
jgi:hypothetical protein